MKKLSFFITLLLLISSAVFAQVSINIDNSAPDGSAMLDVKSTVRGFLPPRMTHVEINAIANPADGLVVYCIDCGITGTGAFLGYFLGTWNSLLTCNSTLNPNQWVTCGIDKPNNLELESCVRCNRV